MTAKPVASSAGAGVEFDRMPIEEVAELEHQRNGPPHNECVAACEACRQLRIADNASVQVAPRPKPTPCPNCDAWIEYGSSRCGGCGTRFRHG